MHMENSQQWVHIFFDGVGVCGYSTISNQFISSEKMFSNIFQIENRNAIWYACNINMLATNNNNNNKKISCILNQPPINCWFRLHRLSFQLMDEIIRFSIESKENAFDYIHSNHCYWFIKQNSCEKRDRVSTENTQASKVVAITLSKLWLLNFGFLRN